MVVTMEPNIVANQTRILLRNAFPTAAWVETGIYLGDTTHFLSKYASKLISIEPETNLFAEAKKHLSGVLHVEIINGASKTVFAGLLPKLSADLNFWLDGHYSRGTTWATHKGGSKSPIKRELSQIEQNLNNFERLVVLVDDVRSFQANDFACGYPDLDYLINWSRRLGLKWHIE